MSRNRAPEDQRRDEILAAAYRVAARERLTGLTVRGVAAEAGVSSGLVLFYFASKDALLVALLDWLLARTIVAHVDEGVHRLPTPQERLLAVVRHDIERLPEKRARVELFFDFWVMGTRHPEIQKKIRGALDRYRDALRPWAADVVEAEPERYQGVTADGLAAVAAGVIEGCALQVVMDPERFDVDHYLRSLEAVVAQPALSGW
jgi:TetR/AcrR family transcriptional repressor of bet genes